MHVMLHDFVMYVIQRLTDQHIYLILGAFPIGYIMRWEKKRTKNKTGGLAGIQFNYNLIFKISLFSYISPDIVDHWAAETRQTFGGIIYCMKLSKQHFQMMTIDCR